MSTGGANQIADYFRGLFRFSASALDRLPIRLTPQPVSYVADILEAAIDGRRSDEASAIRALGRVAHDPQLERKRPVGLNTVGILSDRLTILAVKVWFLRHKHHKDAAAQSIVDNEVEDIVAAIAQARPGSSTVLQKITGLKADIHNRDWAESYYGLLTANLLMWEAQEAMYINNMSDCSGDEVRACLSWCSYGNLRRNQYITSCEVLYWASHAASVGA